MCRRVECSRCGRPTFAGCGQHVEQVLGNVPRDERCRCREQEHPRGHEPNDQHERLGRLARWLTR